LPVFEASDPPTKDVPLPTALPAITPPVTMNEATIRAFAEVRDIG
jgi:hypothetical protein